MALRIGPLRDSTDGARRLGAISFVICAAPSLLAKERPPRSPEQLSARKLLVFQTASGSPVWSFSSSSRTIDVAVGSAVIEANSYAVLFAAATSGLGFARLPSFFAMPALETGTLLRVLPRWRCPELPVHALFRRGMETVRVRALLAHLAAALDDPTEQS